MKKNLSFHKEVARYKGWASLEWRRGIYLSLAKSLISDLRSLEQCDKSNNKRYSVQPANLIVLLQDLKVYHSPVDLVHYAIHSCTKP